MSIKNKKSRLAIKEFIAIFVLLILGVGLPILLTYEKLNYIEINCDKDFKKYASSGDGSVEDPFIIENLQISEEWNIAIAIMNTTQHFIIRNCVLSNNFFYGIYIANVANGTAKIYDNYIYGHSIAGIQIAFSNEVLVYNNELNKNSEGITLFESSNSVVENNKIYSPTITSGPNSQLLEGINVRNSENIIVDNNIIEKIAKGILIEGSKECSITNNYGYLLSHIGYLVSSSSNCGIINNTCSSETIYGFQIMNSIFIALYSNEAINSYFGVYLSNSNNNSISGNRLENNNFGIQTLNSQFNIMNYNNLTRNLEEGIIISSGEYSIIYHNIFIDNNLGSSSQARDDGQNNTWYSNDLMEGNYYNDYNNTGYYEIAGSANATDIYPLLNTDFYSYFHKDYKSEVAKNCGFSSLIKELRNNSKIAARKYDGFICDERRS